jgi:histone H4
VVYSLLTEDELSECSDTEGKSKKRVRVQDGSVVMEQMQYWQTSSQRKAGVRGKPTWIRKWSKRMNAAGVTQEELAAASVSAAEESDLTEVENGDHPKVAAAKEQRKAVVMRLEEYEKAIALGDSGEDIPPEMADTVYAANVARVSAERLAEEITRDATEEQLAGEELNDEEDGPLPPVQSEDGLKTLTDAIERMTTNVEIGLVPDLSAPVGSPWVPAESQEDPILEVFEPAAPEPEIRNGKQPAVENDEIPEIRLMPEIEESPEYYDPDEDQSGPSSQPAPAPRPTTGGKCPRKAYPVWKPKRYQKVRKTTILSNNEIRRLARRGGVKRISSLVYDIGRDALKTFLQEVLGVSVRVCEHSKRKTITVNDIVYGLRVARNMRLYPGN